MSMAAFSGGSTSAASTLAPTTFRRSNGVPRARRSSGMASSSSSATRRPIRFVLALNAETGETVWKTERDELPSWGTPTVAMTPAGPELVTNAANFIRGYDPRTGKELWRLGGSSKITAPTPIFGGGVFVVASGRAPEAPIFVVRPGARGDVTLHGGNTSNRAIVWSLGNRGPYMPTPLIYNGLLYVVANNGIFDAYDLLTGEASIAGGFHRSAAASALLRWPPTARSTSRTRMARSSSSQPAGSSGTSRRTGSENC